jgi:hypothetical protein
VAAFVVRDDTLVMRGVRAPDPVRSAIYLDQATFDILLRVNAEES